MAYAMGINLFLLGAEVFKEFYSGDAGAALHALPLVRPGLAHTRSCPTPGRPSARAARPS